MIQLEIENEKFSSQNRINQEVIKELQNKSNNLFENLTMLQTETEDKKNHTEEELERLHSKLKETEEEMFAIKKKSNLKRRNY